MGQQSKGMTGGQTGDWSKILGGALGNYGPPKGPLASMGGPIGPYHMQPVAGSASGGNWLTGAAPGVATGTTASPSDDVLKQMYRLKMAGGSKPMNPASMMTTGTWYGPPPSVNR